MKIPAWLQAERDALRAKLGWIGNHPPMFANKVASSSKPNVQRGPTEDELLQAKKAVRAHVLAAIKLPEAVGKESLAIKLALTPDLELSDVALVLRRTPASAKHGVFGCETRAMMHDLATRVRNGEKIDDTEQNHG